MLRLLNDDQGRGVGVVARGPAAHATYPAASVVLVSGGFQDNPELTTRYLGVWADRLIVRSNPYSGLSSK